MVDGGVEKTAGKQVNPDRRLVPHRGGDAGSRLATCRTDPLLEVTSQLFATIAEADRGPLRGEGDRCCPAVVCDVKDALAFPRPARWRIRKSTPRI
jgi:hypothetical protein